MANIILTNTSDFDQVRSYLGINAKQISDAILAGFMFTSLAEAVMTKALANQAANGVADVPTIMGLSANDPDQIFLKAATAAYLGWRIALSEPNIVATTISDESQTYQYSANGPVYMNAQREIAANDCAFALSQITNWVGSTATVFDVGGPTSLGVLADTPSGLPMFSLGRY